MSKLVFGAVFVGNMLFSVFFAYTTYLASSWMISDDVLGSDNLHIVDWLKIAISRFLWGQAAALVVFVIVGYVNKLIYSAVFPERIKLKWLIAGFPGILIALSNAFGCARFYLDKPMM